jgi:ATP-dependent DNA ligase
MYPPRPKRKIPPNKVSDYEKKGYFAQFKFNGTRTLVEFKDGDIKLWTRHKTAHKRYKISKEMKSDLLKIYKTLGIDENHIIDGELMHSKIKGLKDIFIAFDLLVYKNEYLLDTRAMERYILLQSILGSPDERESKTGKQIALDVLEHVWLAETFCMSFEERFKHAIELDEIEGLVLKKVSGKLERGFREENNGSWLIRCRKEHKNYAF